jgi:hypothetical protein
MTPDVRLRRESRSGRRGSLAIKVIEAVQHQEGHLLGERAGRESTPSTQRARPLAPLGPSTSRASLLPDRRP